MGQRTLWITKDTKGEMASFFAASREWCAGEGTVNHKGTKGTKDTKGKMGSYGSFHSAGMAFLGAGAGRFRVPPPRPAARP